MSDGNMVKIWGHDGITWQKLNLLFGYYDNFAEVKTLVAAAGDNSLHHTIIPSGYIWLVCFWMARNESRNVRIELLPYISAQTLPIKDTTQTSTTDGVKAELYSPLILKEDDYITARFRACIAGDQLRSYLIGYKMKIS